MTVANSTISCVANIIKNAITKANFSWNSNSKLCFKFHLMSSRHFV